MKKTGFAFLFIPSLLLCNLATSVFAQDLQSAIKLTRSEQFRKAEQTFQILLKRNPVEADIYFYYGENYLQKYFSDTLTYSYAEVFDSASRLFRTGIEKQPENPLNYVGMGEIELIRNKVSDAQSYFNQALCMLPSKSNKESGLSKKEQAVVMIKIANAYIKAHVKDTSRVLTLLRNAEKLDNRNFDLYIVKGDVYMQFLVDGSTAISNYDKVFR